jgi:hypothetical protein
MTRTEVETILGPPGFHATGKLAPVGTLRWADRLREFLRQVGVRPGTVFEVFADRWEPGHPWRRIEVFGQDVWLTKREC